MIRYKMAAHKRGSDYYASPDQPGFTLWPRGAIITNVTRAEAQVMERALNIALRAGKLDKLTLEALP